MAGTVKALREGQHTITPHLVVSGASKALEFYKNAFDAEILNVHKTPDGKVMHAEMKIGDSTIMLADEFPGFSKSPTTLGGSTVLLNLYRDNIDELFNQAVKAGATVDDAAGQSVLGRPLRPA